MSLHPRGPAGQLCSRNGAAQQREPPGIQGWAGAAGNTEQLEQPQAVEGPHRFGGIQLAEPCPALGHLSAQVHLKDSSTEGSWEWSCATSLSWGSHIAPSLFQGIMGTWNGLG